MALEKEIILDFDGTELAFEVNLAAYNKYQNTIAMNNKIQPATNFLLSVANTKTKKTLREIFEAFPGAALNICAFVTDDYQPEFNITVKKSSSEQVKSAKAE